MAAAKSRSAGASNTGLPPRTTSVWTVPPFIADDQRGQRAHARKRRIPGLEVADRLAGVAERRVQGADGGVDGRGLAVASHDQPLAAVRQKVLRKGVDPARRRHPGRRLPAAAAGSNACREGREEGGDLPALETEPMIRHRSRQREDPFNSVEPVHLAARGSRTSSGREASRVTDHLGVGQERVGVEGEDDRRLIDPEHQVDVAPGGGPQAREPVLVADRLVGRPRRLRIAGAELGGQARQGGGGEGLGEDRETGATIRGMSLGQLAPGRHEIGPGLRLAFQSDRVASGRDRRGRARTPGSASSRPRASRGAPGFLRSWSAVLRGSRR